MGGMAGLTAALWLGRMGVGGVPHESNKLGSPVHHPVSPDGTVACMANLGSEGPLGTAAKEISANSSRRVLCSPIGMRNRSPATR